VVSKALGLNLIAVMPRGQTIEKERMIELFGAKIHLVDPVPFANQAHFYHTAKNMAQENNNFWWANQFENLSNFKAHYEGSAQEIWQQTKGDIEAFVCAAGTGGSIGGISKKLKEKNAKIKTYLVDPAGSGLCHYFHHGEFKSLGSSKTEGIGIMRLTENFKQAQIDDAFTLEDEALVDVANSVRNNDGIVLGLSSALNVAAALKIALKTPGKGKNIVTLMCDLGERSYSKLYASGINENNR
jgi:cysteine synthase A